MKDALITRPDISNGQYHGGIKMYRTMANQPVVANFSGAYTLDTYVTTVVFFDGQYSLAINVLLSLSESMSITSSEVVNSVFGLSLVEAVSVIGNNLWGKAAELLLSEGATLSDAKTINTILSVVLPESLGVADVYASNDVLAAYVVNLVTGAVTTYSNFGFNSFAKVGNKYLAAASDGIYLLDGNDDSGAQIDASVVLPMTDLATELVPQDVLKRVPTVYLGVASSGVLVLKVTANGGTNYYSLTSATTSGAQTGRILLGKGVAARYWDFELTNVSGADFVLESITFHPVALARRVGR